MSQPPDIAIRPLSARDHAWATRLLDAEWAAMAATTHSTTLRPDLAVYRGGLDEYVTWPLVEFALQSRLNKLVLINPDGRVLYDTVQPERLLTSFDFWALDGQEIRQALDGHPAASPAYTAGAEPRKRYYAPILDQSGKTAALLCLVAGRDYLGQIDRLARGTRRLNLALTLLLAGVGWMIYGLLRRQRRMEQASAEADRLAALGRLAAGFAHELRNPLEIIRAFTEDLARTLHSPAEGPEGRAHAAEACGDIVEEVDRMNHLVGQFLNYSRGGRASADAPGALAPASAPASAMEELRAVLTILAPMAERQGVRLDPAVQAAAAADEARVALGVDSLKQVLMNLLLNAIQVSPRGGRVWTEVRASGRAVELRVCDEGSGVAASDRARIFEPFFTTRTDGAGLGLAISRQIAAAAGGSLDLAAPPNGRGACFMLSLPRA